MSQKRYYALDWLRAIACVGIMAMHVMVNVPYDLPGPLFNRILSSFTDFVFLFMAVSSFGLCCGYYQRFANGSMDWEHFYRRRFARILPFFIVLILMDLCVSFSFDSLMQGLVESTLFHGFIPLEFTVIGVGWFLGLIFIFYLSFPFFCVLLKDKRRGWLAFAVAFGLSAICQYYFGIDRSNFAVSFCYFLIGGLVYLYRDAIEGTSWRYFFIALVLSIILYYLNTNIVTISLLTASILSLAVSLSIRSPKAIGFLSGISMEVYLCHMAVFRILDKTHLIEALGSGLLQYLITCLIVLFGACIMSVSINYILEKIFQAVKNGKTLDTAQ